MHATDATSSRSIPLEEHATAAFVSNPAKGPTFAERREAALVERYGRWLAEHGQAATRNEIRLASQPRPLYTDLFNEHTRELVEAKGTATRNQVRLGLGQVLDYARYVEHERLAVLLPVRPAEDLVELLTAYVPELCLSVRRALTCNGCAPRYSQAMADDGAFRCMNCYGPLGPDGLDDPGI